MAEVLLLGLIGFGGLMREESGRKPWGIVWFPLAFLVLLLLEKQAEMIGFYMAILAICDPAATITGKLLSQTAKRRRGMSAPPLPSPKTAFPHWLITPYQLTGDPKTLAGNSAFFISFLMLCFLFPAVDFTWGADSGKPVSVFFYDYTSWAPFLLVGILLTLGEALGSKGLDNLIIPLLASILFLFFRIAPSGVAAVTSLSVIAITLAVPFSYLTVRRRSLSLGGAITASLLGIMVVLSTGAIWLIPLFLFFGSSSLIGKLFPATVPAGDAKQKQPRDAIQVLANGGVYTVIAAWMWYNQTLDIIRVHTIPWELLLLTAAAVATADTWSSELGQYFHRPTWDLVKWRRVPAGLSGGISWPGTLAGLGGAAFIAVFGVFLVPHTSPGDLLQVATLGFAGMLLDSMLGSILQATYRDPQTGALSDVCPPAGELVSGFRWISNDLVNGIAIFLTVILARIVL